MVRIGAVQMPLHADSAWKAGKRVLKRAKSAEPVDFLCFPGMALTAGITITPEHVDYAFSELSREANWRYLVIGGIEAAGDKFQNNVYLVEPDGTYRKHQKTEASYFEKRGMEVGKTLEPFDTDFGKVGFLECVELMESDNTQTLINRGAQGIFGVTTWAYRTKTTEDPRFGPSSLEHYLEGNLEVCRQNGVPFILSASSALKRSDGSDVLVASGTRIVDYDGRTVASTRELDDIIYADVTFGNPR